MKRIAAVLLLTFAIRTSGQTTTATTSLVPFRQVKGAAKDRFEKQRELDFAIEQSKPYVYIKFDHIAKRKPLSDDEAPNGLWLRLVNNCRVPISVHFFDPGTGDPGLGLYDEIVPLSVGISYVDASGILHDGPGPEKAPKGYSPETDVVSTKIIEPGDNLLFSVPLRHVSPHWFLRVRFEVVPKKGPGVQPYSYVEFSWTDIPEKLRE